jgi:phage shock protein PspC (stress-responsive transcriptional regulator)
MDKTININLGGTLFQIDEAAFGKLKDYLQSINNKFKNTPGGNETIEDIESRIAEIFISMKGTAGVISSENVDEMIKLIGKPEDFDQPGTENETQRPSYGHPGARKKMFRNPENKIISGLCGGIGAYLNTDPVWIRILFVIFSFVFCIGVFIYLALWLAIPLAESDSQMKEMYGGQHNWAMPQEWDQHPGNRLGHALNEMFKALGKVFYIFVRVILIIFGTSIVLTGFLALLAFIMVFVFKYPGSFSTDIQGLNIAYLPDFINYIVSPAAAPWIKALIIAVVTLPLLALIYGGIRLIFWFSARDGFVWLTGFVLWVLCATALAIVLFNEGVSYGETESSVSKDYLKLPSDTLYIVPGRKLADLRAGNEISIPDKGGHGYNIFISEEKREINIKTHLDLSTSDVNSAGIEITRHSAGRNRLAAIENSKRLIYNYRLSADTLYLDEFFSIPPASKWSLDFVNLDVSIPEGTIVYIDKNISETILRTDYNEDFLSESKNGFWKMTSNGAYHFKPSERRDR